MSQIPGSSDTGNKTGIASKAAKPKIDFSSFRQTMLDEHKKQHPNEPFNLLDFQKKCVARWNALNNYVPPEEVKDPDAPKEPDSAFTWFSYDEERKVKNAFPRFNAVEITKELERRWAAADEDTKETYEDLAFGDEVRYQDEMKKYRASQAAAASGNDYDDDDDE